MALREHMERSGTWLFRWRSYPPLIAVAAAALEMRHYQFPDGPWTELSWELTCLAISLLGFVVRAVAIGYAPPGTSGQNTVGGPAAASLNTTGLYSVVRHPLYLGNFLMWLGLAMLPRSAWLVVVIALAFWLYYERIMFAEEEFLRRRFGETFERWAERTPAVVPNPFRRDAWRPSDRPFSLRAVLRREYSGVLALASVFTALDLIGNEAAAGRAEPGEVGWTVLIVGLSLYVTLHTIKRHTWLLSDRPR